MSQKVWPYSGWKSRIGLMKGCRMLGENMMDAVPSEPLDIALWLGHENVETTSIYLQADMQLKEQALAKTTAAQARATRYRPSDRLLAFLKAL